MDRFYIPSAQFDLQNLKLTGPEAHHCTSVMRHKTGDQIVVFNGAGHEVMAEIVSIEKGDLSLKIKNQIKSSPLPFEITLAQAIPKGKNMDVIVQKATEIGVRSIIPVLSDRTIVQVDTESSDQKTQKWQHVVIEAAKQCGTNWIPTVETPVVLKSFFSHKLPYDLMLIASLQSDALHFKKVLNRFEEENKGALPKSVLILIGPEGDFTPAEISRAKGAGCQPITLGPLVLRSETAAIYAVSILAYELQVLK
ncbi:MAG: 16S rRNA (uracil(1498)-N(3))-methyltransferase [Verrucomicrobiota bacterium]|nr:16S rRNA (uracil(1498)-N(3))-methyltransferase [Verrucomicrobiota bacterium]